MPDHLKIGFVALLMLMAAELVLGGLQGRTPLEVLAGRDPVAAVAYYCALAAFALLPAWFAHRRQRSADVASDRRPLR